MSADQPVPVGATVLWPASGRSVQLWWARLDPPAGSVDALRAVLSAEELRRAGMFRFERDRRRFIVAHGLVRHLVAPSAGIAPAEARFSLGPNGKPFLDLPRRQREAVQFSLSRSDERCLIGVSRSGALGVDLERVRDLPEATSIARRFFSACDAGALDGLPPSEQAGAFFECWTRTEAYVKALGTGLSGVYDGSGVPCWACGGSRCGPPGATSGMGQWCVVGLRPETGYRAAVALPSRFGDHPGPGRGSKGVGAWADSPAEPTAGGGEHGRGGDPREAEPDRGAP